MPFELFKNDKTGKFYFRLKANNGEVILSSQAYSNKAGASNGIQSVMKNCVPECIEKLEAKDGRGYFVLKSSNGQIVGKSGMYKSKSGLAKGINSVMKNAKEGKIKDLTA